MKQIAGKKGMEMWVIVLMVLALILLLLVIAWYKDLGSFIQSLLDRFGGMW